MFQNSKYVSGEPFTRRYYVENKDNVEIMPFEYDRKLKKWFPYGPGQDTISKEHFQRLMKVRPILHLTRDDETGFDFKNTMTGEVIACRAYSDEHKWTCSKGKSWYGKGLEIMEDGLKNKDDALEYVLRGRQ